MTEKRDDRTFFHIVSLQEEQRAVQSVQVFSGHQCVAAGALNKEIGF